MSKQNLRVWATLAVAAALFATMGQSCIPRPTRDLTVTATAAPTSGTNSVAVTLTATVENGTEPYTYAWTASPATTITNADQATATATVTATTTFTCTVTDADSDTATDTATVTVTQAIQVTASAPTSALGGETVNLLALVTNSSGAVSFSWLMTAAGSAGTASVTNQSSQTASVTFSADAAGTFTFQVTATDSAGTDTDTVSIAVTASGAGASTTFTVGTDNLTGTTGNDIFDGGLFFNAPTGTFLTTVQSADRADGGDGTDEMDWEMQDAAAFNPTLSNIEVVNIVATAAGTFNASKTTGMTTLNAENATAKLTVTNLAAIPELQITNSDQNLDFGFAADAIEGTADAMTVSLASVTAGTVTNTSGGIEAYTIESTGATANALTAFVPTSDAETMAITGDQDLDLGAAIGTTYEAVDASAFTGDLTIIMSDAAGDAIEFTGGAGDDTVTGLVAGDDVTADLGAGDDSITIAGFTDGTDSLDGGEGTDTVILTSAVATAFADDIEDIVNFEVLGISNALAGNLDVSYIAGVTDVLLSAGVNGDRSITVSSGSTVTFAADSATGDDDVTILSDTNGTGVAGETVTIELADTVDAGGTITGDLILTGFESATIDSSEIGQAIGGALTINDDVAGAGATTTITITGDEDLTITGVLTADVTNAAAFTGDLTATLAGTSTITGGTGADTLTGSAGADTIAGGAGADTIDGKAANDAINAGAGNDTITGGAGNDSLTGGDGEDTFVFEADAATNGLDTIADFTTDDILDLNTNAGFDQAITATVADTSAAAAAWADLAVLVVTDADGSIDTAAEVAALFGAGAAFEDPANGDAAAVIVQGGGKSTVWFCVEGDADGDFAAGECAQVATLSGFTGTLEDENVGG